MKVKTKRGPQEPRDFNEFVDWASREAHSRLLESGGKGLRSAMHQILSYYGLWKEKEE